MLDLQIIAKGAPVPVFDLPAMLGRADAAREIGDAIEGLIAFMDDLTGDPDLEADLSDYEPEDDAAGDPSWPEWHTRGGHKLQRTQGDHHEPIYGLSGWKAGEDDEDDDPAEEDGEDRCEAGDDMIVSGAASRKGFHVDGGPGDEVDAEETWIEPDERQASVMVTGGFDDQEDDERRFRNRFVLAARIRVQARA